MFTRKAKYAVLPIVALLLATGIAYGQPPEMGRGKGEEMYSRGHRAMIPDLTEAQKEKMKALRIEHMKIVQQLRNQLGEKEARLRTLSTSDKVDMSEINRVIEEMGAMRTQLMKSMAQHRQKIRELLTDEQRVIFDAHQPPHHDGPPHAERRPGRETR